MRKNIIKVKTGVTLVELLAVIVILAILTAIAVPLIGGLIEKTRIRADYATVGTLNTVTRLYSMNQFAGELDIFQGAADNENRMILLFEEGFLDRANIEPQNKEAIYNWDVAEQQWYYISDISRKPIILLDRKKIEQTAKQIKDSFDLYVNNIWIPENETIPSLNTKDYSLILTDINYTGPYATNIKRANFWKQYINSVDGLDIELEAGKIPVVSKLKVYFKCDAEWDKTSEIAGVYIQMGGAKSICFSNETTVILGRDERDSKYVIDNQLVAP